MILVESIPTPYTVVQDKVTAKGKNKVDETDNKKPGYGELKPNVHSLEAVIIMQKSYITTISKS